MTFPRKKGNTRTAQEWMSTLYVCVGDSSYPRKEVKYGMFVEGMIDDEPIGPIEDRRVAISQHKPATIVNHASIRKASGWN